MIEAFVKDARYAIRGLQKQPAFTFAAVMALALGIGATTTIFSVIQNVLLDPYPMYADVDRIVGIQIRDLASARPGGREWYPVAEFLDYQTQAQSFDEVIAGTGEDVVYSSSAGSEQFVGGLTSGNTFNVLGVPAAIGRTLTPEDARPGAPPVFVLSYKLWATRFGLDPSLVGKSFVLNGVPTTLIGVMPARVSKLGADLWRPVRLDPADPALNDHYFRFQGRLKRGVTLEQAQAEMEVIAQRVAKVYPRELPEEVRRPRRRPDRQHRRIVQEDALHHGGRGRPAAADCVRERREHAAEPRVRPREGNGDPRRARSQPRRAGAATPGREPAARAPGSAGRLSLLVRRDQAARLGDPRGADPAGGGDSPEHAGAAVQPGALRD